LRYAAEKTSRQKKKQKQTKQTNKLDFIPPKVSGQCKQKYLISSTNESN